MKSRIIIGGLFNINKPDPITTQLYNELGNNWSCLNNGKESLLSTYEPSYSAEALLWMPFNNRTIFNNVKTIKAECPRAILLLGANITSKYKQSDLVGSMIKYNASYGLAIYPNKIIILDYLNNIHYESSSIKDIASYVNTLIDNLLQKPKTISLPSAREKFKAANIPTDILKEIILFSNTLFKFTNTEYRLLNSMNPLSKGHYAVNIDGVILTTKRELTGKITQTDFVPVINLYDQAVAYKGSNKPNLDTGLFLQIFKVYKNIKYIAHTHQYLKDYPYTTISNLCNYTHVINDIQTLYTNDSLLIIINLLNHGCLIATNNIQDLLPLSNNLIERF